MLGKLLKYEFKATARIFLPLLLAIAVLTPITRFMTSIDVFPGALSIIPGIFAFLYIIMLVAIAVVAGILIIIRFYKNMVTEEGYLMHTLPVTPSQHIWSKAIVSFVWSIVSTFVILVSLFFFLITPERLNTLKEGFGELMSFLHTNLGGDLTICFIEGFILLIIGIFANIFYIYASIALGQMISRHRIVGAFAAAVVMNIVLQVISTILNAVFLFGRGTDFTKTDVIYMLMPGIIIYSLLIAVAYFCITNFILKKKLNLE
jgi:hypothetical protein